MESWVHQLNKASTATVHLPWRSRLVSTSDCNVKLVRPVFLSSPRSLYMSFVIIRPLYHWAFPDQKSSSCRVVVRIPSAWYSPIHVLWWTTLNVGCFLPYCSGTWSYIRYATAPIIARSTPSIIIIITKLRRRWNNARCPIRQMMSMRNAQLLVQGSSIQHEKLNSNRIWHLHHFSFHTQPSRILVNLCNNGRLIVLSTSTRLDLRQFLSSIHHNLRQTRSMSPWQTAISLHFIGYHCTTPLGILMASPVSTNAPIVSPERWPPNPSFAVMLSNNGGGNGSYGQTWCIQSRPFTKS